MGILHTYQMPLINPDVGKVLPLQLGFSANCIIM